MLHEETIKKLSAKIEHLIEVANKLSVENKLLKQTIIEQQTQQTAVVAERDMLKVHIAELEDMVITKESDYEQLRIQTTLMKAETEMETKEREEETSKMLDNLLVGVDDCIRNLS